MSTHIVAENESTLSELIDRAMDGDGVVITRDGEPVVELRRVAARPQKRTKSAKRRLTIEEELEWLQARRARLPMSKIDAGTFVSQMRDEEWER